MAKSNTPFTDYLRRIGARFNNDKSKSVEWLKQQARKLNQPRVHKITNTIASKQRGSTPQAGSMYMFAYDPKYKDILPYYDAMPLIMVINVGAKSMLGLNFHYLPPIRRAQLLDFFSREAKKRSPVGKIGSNSIANLSYAQIRALASDSLIKPTIHRYLYSHLASGLTEINPLEWDVTIMLPTAQFVSKGKGSAVIRRGLRFKL